LEKIAVKNESLTRVADFYSTYADYPLCNIKSGEIIVAGSDKRYKEMGNCILWAGVFRDRYIISTQHELVDRVQTIVRKVFSPRQIFLNEMRDYLIALYHEILGDENACYVYSGTKLYCDKQTYVHTKDNNVRKITRKNAGEVIERLLPVGIPDDVDYLLTDDVAFAYYTWEQPVAFAGTHPVGSMTDKIGNVMVGTLEQYRRQGYGKAVVSATTGALLEQGRIAVYGTSDDNIASIRTALSVGFIVYCQILEIRYALDQTE
jgi:GNAT superfamily N-acetyltransferase